MEHLLLRYHLSQSISVNPKNLIFSANPQFVRILVSYSLRHFDLRILRESSMRHKPIKPKILETRILEPNLERIFLLATRLASRSWKVFPEQSSSNLPHGCLTPQCVDPLCRDFPWPSMISILLFFQVCHTTCGLVSNRKLLMHCAFARLIEWMSNIT